MRLCNPFLGPSAVGHASDNWLAQCGKPHGACYPLGCLGQVSLKKCHFNPILPWIDKIVSCAMMNLSSESEAKLFLLGAIALSLEFAQ